MPGRRRWVLLVTVAAGLLLITLDNSILYTALPTLTRELGASGSQALWIINAYPLVMAGLLLGAGTLGDRIGHRRMFMIGLVIFGAASMYAAFAGSPSHLIAARAVLAVGAASMMPATLALIRIGFVNVRERNLAIAIWGLISVIGMALGPIVSGVLLTSFWWGSVFLINVPVVLAALAVTPWVAPRGTPDPSRSWDVLSSVLAMTVLVASVLFIKEAPLEGRSIELLLITSAVAVAGGYAFARRQRGLSYPLLDFAIFTNPAFRTGVLAAALTMFAVAGLQLVITQRYQLVAGFSPLQAGLLMTAIAVGAALTSVVAGAVLHRVGLRIIITGGLVLGAMGAVGVTATVGHSTTALALSLALVGAGVAAVMAVASTAIVGNAPRHRAGMASSVEEVSYEFGNLLAVSLLGTLLSAVYAASIRLPQGAPTAAGDSLADALRTAADDPAVLQAAMSAFDGSVRAVAAVVAAVLAIGAAFAVIALRNYGPGSAASLPDAEH